MTNSLLLHDRITHATPAPDSDLDVEEMLSAVAANFQATKAITRCDAQAETLKAMRQVPRHEFVPQDWQEHAYTNAAVTIGHGQTVPQPFIVALMIELLDLRLDYKLLEIGTGSGYQAAVISQLVSQVYSVELNSKLAEQAAARLLSLGYANVTVSAHDGNDGWSKYSLYDRILVTAAARRVPMELVDQLRLGGKIVIPIGEPLQPQTLTVVTKIANRVVERREVLPVAFVPMEKR